MHTADAFMGQNLRPSETRLVSNLDVFCSADHLGNSDPAANCILPPDYASLDKRVGLYHCAPENSAVGDLYSRTDFALCSDYDVWSELGCRVDFSRRMDNH